MSKLSLSGDIQSNKDKVIAKVTAVITSRLAKIKRELEELQKEILKFEKRYSQTTEEFLKVFASGTLGDSEEWFVWEASVKMIAALKEEQQLLFDAI